MTDDDAAAPSTAEGVLAAGAGHAGNAVVRTTWIGTAVFTVSAAAAVVFEAARPIAVGVSLVLFAAGLVTFLWSYAIAVGRSRTDAIGIGGLYFLAGATAPASVRRRLLGALAVQCLVAVATAAARPYTSLAFGVLVPMFGLGLSGLWGARHGSFGPRSGG